MGQAVGTFYNYSGGLTCNDFGGGPNPETDEDGNFWDFQWCTEMLMPASRNGGAQRACLCTVAVRMAVWGGSVLWLCIWLE